MSNTAPSTYRFRHQLHSFLSSSPSTAIPISTLTVRLWEACSFDEKISFCRAGKNKLMLGLSIARYPGTRYRVSTSTLESTATSVCPSPILAVWLTLWNPLTVATNTPEFMLVTTRPVVSTTGCLDRCCRDLRHNILQQQQLSSTWWRLCSKLMGNIKTTTLLNMAVDTIIKNCRHLPDLYYHNDHANNSTGQLVQTVMLQVYEAIFACIRTPSSGTIRERLVNQPSWTVHEIGCKVIWIWKIFPFRIDNLTECIE